jgi:hypothetical protein
VTVTVLALIVAVFEIVNVAVISVEFTTMTALTATPVPVIATDVPVAVKFVPVRVMGTAVPRTPEPGERGAKVGTAGAATVKPTVFVAPMGVVTLTFQVVRAAPAVMVNVAVTSESFITVSALTVMPAPTPVIAVAPVSPLPINVTGTLAPWLPVLGEIEVNIAPTTVNVWLLLVPLTVFTLTVLAVSPVPVVMVNVVVRVVEFTTVIAPTVKPAPETLTVVPVVVKLVPVRVTGTDVPRWPLVGLIEASVGAAGLTTVRLKFCTALLPTPLLAVNVM